MRIELYRWFGAHIFGAQGSPVAKKSIPSPGSVDEMAGILGMVRDPDQSHRLSGSFSFRQGGWLAWVTLEVNLDCKDKVADRNLS